MEKVSITFPNIGEDLIDVKVVQNWKPSGITVIGSTVSFYQDNLYLSMKEDDYKRIFVK